jgi:hypothetical protein
MARFSRAAEPRILPQARNLQMRWLGREKYAEQGVGIFLQIYRERETWENGSLNGRPTPAQPTEEVHGR